MVVAIAIVILPSLYAWLNIYSNWDPYGNTGGISIAVASLDEDYTTPEGETVNKGRDVLDDLRESTRSLSTRRTRPSRASARVTTMPRS